MRALRLVPPVLFSATALIVFLRSLHFGQARSYTLFNSDALYPFAFARDLLDGARLSGWSVPPAPAWVPDLVLAFWGVSLADALRLPPFYAVYISGTLFALLLVAVYGSFFAALRRTDPDAPSPWPAVLWPAALIFLAGATAAEGSLFPWLLVPSFHVGAFLFWPVLAASGVCLLSRRQIDGGSVVSARDMMLVFALVLMGFLGTLSDLFFLLYAWLPLAVAVPLCFPMSRRVVLLWFGSAVLVVFAALWFEGVIDRALVLAPARPNFRGAVSTRGLLAFFEYLGAFFTDAPWQMGAIFAAAAVAAAAVVRGGSGVLRFFALMFVLQALFVLAGSFLANFTRGVETTLYRYLAYLYPAAIFFLWGRSTPGVRWRRWCPGCVRRALRLPWCSKHWCYTGRPERRRRICNWHVV